MRYTQRDGNVYAFLFKFPFGSVTLDEVDYDPALTASLLGSDLRPTVLNENGKVCLAFDPVPPDAIRAQHVYCVKLTK